MRRRVFLNRLLSGAALAATSGTSLVFSGCAARSGGQAVRGGMQARRDPDTGQYEIAEDGKPVLRYNYARVEGGEVLQAVSPGNRKYAVARSDYIHPLYGPSGEPLTLDWPKDHPHHRGIYWAWPEVDWQGRRGDLHALQQIFAQPTGQCLVSSNTRFAQVDAENIWEWEDGSRVVRERAEIRAWRSGPHGRYVDLQFTFTALNGPVLLARRDTDKYGGLSLRFTSVAGQQISKHTDAPVSSPRRSWGQISGTFGRSLEPASVVLLQCASNPDYPGDWVDYPELNWLQPTFPAAGSRYALTSGHPLVLRYRLWVRAGAPASDSDCEKAWQQAHTEWSI